QSTKVLVSLLTIKSNSSIKSKKQSPMKSVILICMLMCSSLNAQPSVNLPKEGSISGTIIDAHLNQPLPYVTIVIKNSNNETVTGSISQDDGNFKISKLPEGQFSVTIQYIGYKTIIQPFSIGKDVYDVNLGRILL